VSESAASSVALPIPSVACWFIFRAPIPRSGSGKLQLSSSVQRVDEKLTMKKSASGISQCVFLSRDQIGQGSEVGPPGSHDGWYGEASVQIVASQEDPHPVPWELDASVRLYKKQIGSVSAASPVALHEDAADRRACVSDIFSRANNRRSLRRPVAAYAKATTENALY